MWAFNKSRYDWFRILTIIVGLLLSIWLGQEAGSGRLNLKLAAIVFGGGLMLLFVLLNQHFQRNLLLLAVGGLLLGYRGADITSTFYIYPSELLIWLGFLLYIFNAALIHQQRLDFSLPQPALWLAAATLIGLVVASKHTSSMSFALLEAKNFIVFIPLIILLQQWVRSMADVRLYVRALIIVGTIIATMGLLERYVPFLSTSLPWLFTAPISLRENFGVSGEIALAGYSFWGTPVVAILLAPIFGLWAMSLRATHGLQKWFWTPFGLILFSGIIVAGYRSAWLSLIVVLLLVLLINRTASLWLLLGAIVGVYFLPQAFLDRFSTLLLLNQSGDTSLLRRSDALYRGIQTVFEYPFFGTGWNSPAVFNDWLYLAVSLGLPSVVVFGYWYLTLLHRLKKIMQRATKLGRGEASWLAGGFTIGLAGYAVGMLSGAMSQVPPLMTGFWLIFCLGFRFTELEIKDKTEMVSGEVVSVAAHF